MRTTWTVAALAAALSTAAAAQDFYNDPAAVEAAMRGTWKTAAGTCAAPFLKSGAAIKSDTGQLQGLSVTLANSGTTIEGTLMVAGARRSQIVKPMTEQVLFLASFEGNKIHLSPVGEPVLGWPEVDLDLCPGSRT